MTAIQIPADVRCQQQGEPRTNPVQRICRVERRHVGAGFCFIRIGNIVVAAEAEGAESGSKTMTKPSPSGDQACCSRAASSIALKAITADSITT